MLIDSKIIVLSTHIKQIINMAHKVQHPFDSYLHYITFMHITRIDTKAVNIFFLSTSYVLLTNRLVNTACTLEYLFIALPIGFFTSRNEIACYTSLSSSENSSQEWWTLTNCTNPVFAEEDRVGPLILLIYSQRIASQLLNVIAGFG